MVKMTQPKLYNRGKKLWVRFSYNGEVVKKSLSIEDNKANRKLALTQIIPQMLLQVHSGKFFDNKIVPTLSEMIEKSMAMNTNNRKHLTQYAYKGMFKKHVIPTLGQMKLDEIKPSDLKSWQNDLLNHFSSSYVIDIRIILNGVFEDALRDEIISRNPLSLVKYPVRDDEPEINPFSKKEIFQILDAVNDKIKLFIAIGFFTGARTGEITALKWKDIDLENKTISILATRNKGIETSPKTKSSIREIEILDVLIPYIQNHMKYKIDDSIYVFNSNRKKPYSTAYKISEYYWQPLLDDLEIEYRTMYQMRHTFASMMISNGEDILWVSKMLGHKNAYITLSTYARFIQGEKKVRASFLNN